MTLIEHDDERYSQPDTREVSAGADVAAEIGQQVLTAHRFPRRRDEIIRHEISSRATFNLEIAEECRYEVERGGEMQSGPSIRFAEIVYASYGNLSVGSRFVRIDRDEPEAQAVIAEGVCIDVQVNNRRVVTERRSIMTSARGGKTPRRYNADMINITYKAAAAIAAREAILRCVPKAVWGQAFDNVEAVIRGDANTLEKRRQDVIEAFGRKKIVPERVYAALGVVSIADITIEHMLKLKGWMQAIKEGESPENVLGRAEAAFAAPAAVVANPLRSTAPAPGEVIDFAGAPGAAAAAQEPARAAAADKASSTPAVPAAAAAESAPEAAPRAAAPPSAAPPPEAASYFDLAMATIKKSTSLPGLMDWWRRSTPSREHAGLSAEMTEALQKARDERTGALQRAEPQT